MAYINTARRKQRFVFTNDRELYDDILTRKRVQAIRQYSTLNLTPFRANLDNKIQEINHIWKTGDRYFKLASQYYGRPELWWIRMNLIIGSTLTTTKTA